MLQLKVCDNFVNSVDLSFTKMLTYVLKYHTLIRFKLSSFLHSLFLMFCKLVQPNEIITTISVKNINIYVCVHFKQRLNLIHSSLQHRLCTLHIYFAV